MKRYPASVYGSGTEPDPRFTLANERTFLAWIRTSGALFALAFALDAFDVSLTPWVQDAIVLILTFGALFGAIEAWWNWKRTERAMRLAQPLPSGGPNLVVAVLVAISLVLFLVDSFVVGSGMW